MTPTGLPRFVAAILLSVCGMRAPALAQQFQSGVCVHVGQNRNSLSLTQHALDSAGLTFRDEVFWHRLETKEGVLQYPASLADLDALVDATVRSGRKPLLILDYGAKFYDDGDLIASQPARDAYARYVRFVVRHFKNRVSQFEVWNEWNIGLGSPRKPRTLGTPEAYVALLRTAYSAVKAENPQATVIGGAVAGIDDRWVDAFGRAGGFSSLDAFSIHPYIYQQPHPLPEEAMHRLDLLKQRIDGYAPGRNIAVYITEMGWPSHDGPLGTPPLLVAAYLQRFMLLAKARPWIAGVWWYDLFDDGDDARNKENRFGLLSRNGAPKPAFDSLLAIKPLLQSASAFVASSTADGRVVVKGRSRDGKRFVASWLPIADGTRQSPWADAHGMLESGYTILGRPDVGASEVKLGAMPVVVIEK
jgi:polysaccharide biosynthesis protein PslG